MQFTKLMIYLKATKITVDELKHNIELLSRTWEAMDAPRMISSYDYSLPLLMNKLLLITLASGGELNIKSSVMDIIEPVADKPEYKNVSIVDMMAKEGTKKVATWEEVEEGIRRHSLSLNCGGTDKIKRAYDLIEASRSYSVISCYAKTTNPEKPAWKPATVVSMMTKEIIPLIDLLHHQVLGYVSHSINNYLSDEAINQYLSTPPHYKDINLLLFPSPGFRSKFYDAVSFNMGCAFKYIVRAGKKGELEEDLDKARHYIEAILTPPSGDANLALIASVKARLGCVPDAVLSKPLRDAAASLLGGQYASALGAIERAKNKK